MTRDQLLTDLARALRVRVGDAEADAHVRSLEPWLDVGWPLPPRAKREATSPRPAIDAAELAVVDAFPDRAPELLRFLARASAAAMLAEAVTWDSIKTSSDHLSPFRRIPMEPVKFENAELAFHRADAAAKQALLDEITGERASSLIRRRVKLKAGSLEGGQILLTALNWGGVELVASDFWLEIVTLDETSQRGGPAECLVTWIPAARVPTVNEALASSSQHAWAADAAERWQVQAWRPGWIR